MQTQATTTETTSPADRRTEFAPVEGGGNETSAMALLATAYLLMWALLMAFILMTHRRQRLLRGRIDELDAALKQKEGSADGAA